MSDSDIPISLPPLTTFAATINQNFTEMMKHLAKLSAGAEAVHGGFQSLLTQEVAPKGIPMATAHTMGWAAHSAWIDGFVLTGAGHLDTGFAAVRRAIEFTCYAAKVAKSKQRAQDWVNFATDPDARPVFRGPKIVT